MKKSARKNTERKAGSWNKIQESNWRNNADFWIQAMQKNLDPFRSSLTNKTILQAVPKSTKKILDAGCGEGYLARLLSKKGARVFGIDKTPAFIRAAEALERKRPLGIQYRRSDIRNTGFPSSFFEIVVSHHSIQEIANPEKALGEFARILKKKGKLLLLFLHPCFDFKEKDVGKNQLVNLYFQRTTIQKPYFLVGGIKSPSPYSYLHLPLQDWVRIIQQAGFTIESIQEPHPLTRLLRKLWWRENFKSPRFIFVVAQKK